MTAHPRLALVGKGVCFDSGGLDIKPADGMLLMKKDMGGAANVLGLASIIMDAQLPVRLHVLIPAVENAISGNAFRPGDILDSRKGDTVEIGNTDAEGRLVLADALTKALESEPELLIDMATLTGAARIALGPEVSPFYTDDDALAGEIAAAGRRLMIRFGACRLWDGYDEWLDSPIADLSSTGGSRFAGSITAALFLRRFAGAAKAWVHFDIFAWNPRAPSGAAERRGDARRARPVGHVETALWRISRHPFQVTAGVAPVRREPEDDGAQDTQLLAGEVFLVEREAGRLGLWPHGPG
jgi:leucyl aminopeptidase